MASGGREGGLESILDQLATNNLDFMNPTQNVLSLTIADKPSDETAQIMKRVRAHHSRLVAQRARSIDDPKWLPTLSEEQKRKHTGAKALFIQEMKNTITVSKQGLATGEMSNGLGEEELDRLRVYVSTFNDLFTAIISAFSSCRYPEVLFDWCRDHILTRFESSDNNLIPAFHLSAETGKMLKDKLRHVLMQMGRYTTRGIDLQYAVKMLIQHIENSIELSMEDLYHYGGRSDEDYQTRYAVNVSVYCDLFIRIIKAFNSCSSPQDLYIWCRQNVLPHFHNNDLTFQEYRALLEYMVIMPDNFGAKEMEHRRCLTDTTLSAQDSDKLKVELELFLKQMELDRRNQKIQEPIDTLIGEMKNTVHRCSKELHFFKLPTSLGINSHDERKKISRMSEIPRLRVSELYADYDMFTTIISAFKSCSRLKELHLQCQQKLYAWCEQQVLPHYQVIYATPEDYDDLPHGPVHLGKSNLSQQGRVNLKNELKFLLTQMEHPATRKSPWKEWVKYAEYFDFRESSSGRHSPTIPDENEVVYSPFFGITQAYRTNDPPHGAATNSMINRS